MSEENSLLGYGELRMENGEWRFFGNAQWEGACARGGMVMKYF